MESSDDEKAAIKAVEEAKKKGYYHNRPPSTANESYAPRKLSPEEAKAMNTSVRARRVQDPFQAKWDKWDNDNFEPELKEVEERPKNPTRRQRLWQCLVSDACRTLVLALLCVGAAIVGYLLHT
eukprot:GEMP01096012.1.p1 GENE.GEMP01096012.1~~GEMP01096012.1.p1  ORF type:complete len:124 (+),score=31.73 GEMP01096012.1:122-493(+)